MAEAVPIPTILVNGEEESATPEAVSLAKIQEFQSWRRKIKPLMELLDMPPKSHLEIQICTEENKLDGNSQFLLNSQVIPQCQELYDDLFAKVNGKLEDCKGKFKGMMELWEKLLEKNEFGLKFTIADFGVINAMDSLTTQLELRGKEMSQRIEMFIKELRKEISDIWDQCMITEEEKAEFEHFTSEEFSEGMLDIHRNELAKWQIYHKKNMEILTKIKKREEMWEKLKELEAKADDPNRFVNRGGALLKDQNMHNSITKNLPKLEAELIKLSERFEKEHGRKMKILGKEIPVIIEEQWKSFKEEKAAKKHAKQNLPVQQPTNSASHGMPLRARHSILPSQMIPMGGMSAPSTASRPGDKRQASKVPGQSTPMKYGRFGSTKSLNQD